MVGIYLIIGAFAGTMSGLFGIGGGIIVIPALAASFVHHTNIPAQNIMQMAVGTSLATVIITGSAAMYAHHKRHAVIWSQVKKMVPGLTLGAILGAVVAHFLSSNFLRIFFAIFLFLVAIKMFMKQPEIKPGDELSLRTVRIASVIIGLLSSILGVGGGTLLVPFLLRCQLDMVQATGTSVACGISVAMVATISFMIVGMFGGIHVPMSTGYIYWPAFLGIAAASVLFAPVGAALAHSLPKELLKKIFAVFLVIMAADMAFFAK